VIDAALSNLISPDKHPLALDPISQIPGEVFRQEMQGLSAYKYENYA
jgi:hypothetical protein